MTDRFALLDVPRRPWLDVGELKAKFLALSAVQHPDRFHRADAAQREAAQRRFAELNAAYRCLRDPKERLRHLFQLEAGIEPAKLREAPADLLGLFVEVGEACRGAGAFLAERAAGASPLLRAQHLERALDWRDRLQGLLDRLNARRNDLLAELRALNPRWETAPAPPAESRARALPLDRLEQMYRAIGFLTRWTAQVEERLVQLSL